MNYRESGLTLIEILVALGVVLVGAHRQCSEQTFGADSARNNVPSQLSPRTGTHIPHLSCRESYHLGPHFGTIFGAYGHL